MATRPLLATRSYPEAIGREHLSKAHPLARDDSNQPGGCAPIDVADAPLLAEAVAECSHYKHAVIKSLWVRPVHVIIPFG